MPSPCITTDASLDNSARSRQLQELQQALAKVVRALHYRPNAASDLIEMPVVQLRCLNAIAEREGQKMVEVAARTSIGLPGVSRTVDRLVHQGLVLREPDPQDRRAVQLTLTEKARNLLREVEASRLRRIAQATQRIDEADLDRILESLHMLAAAAESSAADQPAAE